MIKETKDIAFPENLEFPGIKDKYDLYATVVHKGESLNSGRYIAYVRMQTLKPPQENADDLIDTHSQQKISQCRRLNLPIQTTPRLPATKS